MNKTIHIDDNFLGTLHIHKGDTVIASLTISGSEVKSSEKSEEHCYDVCVAYDDEGRCLYWNTVCNSIIP
jgi:hypothetical protein